MTSQRTLFISPTTVQHSQRAHRPRIGVKLSNRCFNSAQTHFENKCTTSNVCKEEFLSTTSMDNSCRKSGNNFNFFSQTRARWAHTQSDIVGSQHDTVSLYLSVLCLFIPCCNHKDKRGRYKKSAVACVQRKFSCQGQFTLYASDDKLCLERVQVMGRRAGAPYDVLACVSEQNNDKSLQRGHGVLALQVHNADMPPECNASCVNTAQRRHNLPQSGEQPQDNDVVMEIVISARQRRYCCWRLIRHKYNNI